MKTDPPLQMAVMAELAWEPSIPATPVGVEVRDGVVTLESSAASRRPVPR